MSTNPNASNMQTRDLFNGKLPAELRDTVYKLLVNDDDLAIVLPKPIKVLIREPGKRPQWSEFGIAKNDGFSSVCKSISAEYWPCTETKALKIEHLGGIRAHVFDLDFENLIEGYLTKLDQSARNRLTQLGHLRRIEIEVLLTFTKHFDDLPEDVKETRLKRWLDYRRQSEDENTFIPLELFVHCIRGYAELVRLFFNSTIYKGYGGESMSKISSAVRDTFEGGGLSYEEWQKHPSDGPGKEQGDGADTVTTDIAAGGRGDVEHTGGQQQKLTEPRRSQRLKNKA